jgi:DNA polymerase III gamma/tau subunit
MSFITDFRPTSLKDVVGRDEIVKILTNKLKQSKHPHSYLFFGGSGLGKTTFARIIGHTLNSKIIEFDAGCITGVDSIRDLLEETKYKNVGSKSNKCIIIDECHKLSEAAQNALLKTVEEPPSHVYFVFCTTELKKVLNTIQTRCLQFQLRPLEPDQIFTILKGKVDADDKFLYFISKNCDGSPRTALNLLEKAVEIKDFNKFKEVVKEGIVEEIPLYVLNICKELIKSKPSEVVCINNLKEIKGYEGARIQIFNYLTAVCINGKYNLLDRLSCFADEVKSETTGKGELLIKILTAIGV